MNFSGKCIMKVNVFLLLCLIIVQNLPGTLKADGFEDLINCFGNVISQDVLNKARSEYTPIQSVQFYLYTWYNPTDRQTIRTNDLESVRRSYFDYRNPTRIILHGWNGTPDHECNTLIRDAYLSTGPCNIVYVDWSETSLSEYPQSVLNIPDVASKLAEFIDFMAYQRYLKPENLTIVGFSLGAHIAGVAGRITKCGQVHTIVGLDPSKILLPYDSAEFRLLSTDAYYVESIQTNSFLTSYEKPIGRATFYPNGGGFQPGCDLYIGCSHFRSFKYFAEAIRINGFPSIQCSGYIQAKENKCGSNYSLNVRMGAQSNAYTAKGVFYVPTRSSPPFAII